MLKRYRLPVLAAVLSLAAAPAPAANIVESWNDAKAPPAPTLAPVTVSAADTAYLLLDIEQATCNPALRPRCVAAVPGMAAFLVRARDARMPVFFSNTGGGTRATILPAVAPRADEVVVKASVDKFFGTALGEGLRARGVKTVIVCGTAAFGAVLHTATAAAVNGFRVVLPVDCAPGSSLYEEQATVWSLINGPGTRKALTATTLDSIRIE